MKPLPRNVASLAASVGLASLAVTAGSALAGLPGTSSLSQEPGAIYVEDLFDDPVTLQVLKPAPIFYQLDGQRRLGTLEPDRKVTLIAISDRAYRVRGRATHGDVSGWVGPAFLKAPTDDFDQSMRELYERQKVVNELIENKEVALGMTMDEVVASLGNPDARTSRVDAEGTAESIAYITYRRVPQSVPRRDVYGRYFNATVYVRVETGRRTIHFQDGVASSIEENEQLNPGRTLRVVAPPIILRY